jgi:polyisoprenoid-binding protein YceI
MTTRFRALIEFVCTLAIWLFAVPCLVVGQPLSPPELRMAAARVSIAGTSNIYPFTASTTDVRMSRLVLAPVDGDRLQSAAKAGGVEAFDIAISTASLTSLQEGFDKNMHQALKVSEHQDITFRLLRLEPAAAARSLTAVGLLKIAGIEKEVAFPIRAGVNASTITVIGDVALMMTDYGITPPKAMLGLLKTDPKITVTFEIVLALPQVTTL